MSELLKAISANSWAITTLIIALAVILASIILIYLVAFFQGREIYFWPLKIGPKVESSKNATQSKLACKSERMAPFIDGSDVDLAEIKRLIENAKNIDWIVFTNKKVTELFNISIRRCIDNGGRVRLLLVNPNSSVIQFVSTSKSSEILQKDIESSVAYFSSLREEIKNGSIEIGYLRGYPPYRLALFDRNSNEGFIRLKLLRADNISVTPTIEIKKSEDNLWFEYFVGQFEKYWETSKRIL